MLGNYTQLRRSKEGNSTADSIYTSCCISNSSFEMPRSFLLRRSPHGQEKLQNKGRNFGVLAERFVNRSYGSFEKARPADSGTFWLMGDRKSSMHERINSLTSYTYQSYIDGDLMETKNAIQEGLGKNGTLEAKSKDVDNGSKLVLPTFNGELKGNEAMAQSSTTITTTATTVGTKPVYKCEQCGKTFKTKYTLTIHLKMPNHTGARPFVCNICGKGFRLSSTLCRHKIIHTSEKPHQCHICQKAFNRSSTLKTHVRTHSEKKEFLCDVCGKGFHQKGNLRNHFLIHTGEKPYRCRLCNKAFNKLSNLKFHLHVHTDNTPYRCRYCKTAFSRRCDLKQHIRENHDQDMNDYLDGEEEA